MRSTDWSRWADIAATVAGVSAFAVALLTFLRYISGGLTLEEIRPVVEVDGWAAYHESGRSLGASSAPVVLVEFGDYSCPFSRQSFEEVQAIRQEFDGQVRLVHHHFPVFGADSPGGLGARAAECAGEQEMFWEVHEYLYSSQDWMSENPEDLMAMASTVGLPDLDRFGSCVASGDRMQGIDEGIRAASELGISGTPTYLINNRLHVGPLDLAEFRSIMSQLMEAK